MTIVDAVSLRAATSAQHPTGRHAADPRSAAGFGEAMDQARATDGSLRLGADIPPTGDALDEPRGAATDSPDSVDQSAVTIAAGNSTPEAAAPALSAVQLMHPAAPGLADSEPSTQTPSVQVSTPPTLPATDPTSPPALGTEQRSAVGPQPKSMPPEPPAPAALVAETSAEPNRETSATSASAPATPAETTRPAGVRTADGATQTGVSSETNAVQHSEVSTTEHQSPSVTNAPGLTAVAATDRPTAPELAPPRIGSPTSPTAAPTSQTGAPASVAPPSTFATATGAPTFAAITTDVRAGIDPAEFEAAAPTPVPVAAPTSTAPVAHVATATPATPASTPALPSPLATQIARPVFTLAAAGAGEHVMTINVTPDNLGPITVRAHIGAEGIRLEVFAPTDVARDAMRAILPDLRRDLAGSGMNANLSLSPQNQPGDSRGTAGGGAQSQAGSDTQHRSREQSTRERPTIRPLARHGTVTATHGSTTHIDVMA